MSDGIWLFTELPQWFLFSAVIPPGILGALGPISAIGTVCAIIGIVLAALRRAKSLWVFVIPALISQAYVAFAGLLRGAFESYAVGPPLFPFLIFQLVLALYLIYRLREALLPATLLAAFSISYALFASFMADMAFTNNWI